MWGKTISDVLLLQLLLIAAAVVVLVPACSILGTFSVGVFLSTQWGQIAAMGSTVVLGTALGFVRTDPAFMLAALLCALVCAGLFAPVLNGVSCVVEVLQLF